MFAIGLCLFLLVFMVWSIRTSNKLVKSGHCDDCVGGGWVMRAISGIGLFILAIVPTCNYSSQVDDFATIRATQKKIEIASEKRDRLSAVVRAELAKYPELESKIVGGIQPEILLNFPQLKSNETMVETLKQLVQLQNEVYALRYELNDVQRRAYNREISPWTIYVTPYEKFFGRKNPLLQ